MKCTSKREIYLATAKLAGNMSTPFRQYNTPAHPRSPKNGNLGFGRNYKLRRWKNWKRCSKIATLEENCDSQEMRAATNFNFKNCDGEINLKRKLRQQKHSNFCWTWTIHTKPKSWKPIDFSRSRKANRETTSIYRINFAGTIGIIRRANFIEFWWQLANIRRTVSIGFACGRLCLFCLLCLFCFVVLCFVLFLCL